MNKVELNEVQILELLGELKLLLRVNYDISIPELDKLENIVKNKNYESSNTEKHFGLAFRRLQEIGIYDEDVDRLFRNIYYLTQIS